MPTNPPLMVTYDFDIPFLSYFMERYAGMWQS